MGHRAVGLKELLEKVEDGAAYYLRRLVPHETSREVLSAEGARETIRRFVAGDNYSERYGEENFDVFLYDPPEHWRGAVEDWRDRILDEDAEGYLIGSVEYADEGDAEFWEALEVVRLPDDFPLEEGKT